MPPTTTGTSPMPAARMPRSTSRTSATCAARQDREADHVHALLERGVDDCAGRQADALVDHLHAAVAGAHGDLLGAVGMAVEAGLADQDLEAPAERGATPLDLARARRRGGRRRTPAARATPVGARYSPNTSRSAPAHSPVVTPAWAPAIEAGMMLRSSCAAARELGQRRLDAPRRRARRARPCRRSICSASTSGSTVRMRALAGGQRRGRGLGVAVDADHVLLAATRCAARRSRFDSTSRCLHVAGSTAATAPPMSSMRASSAGASAFSSSTLAATTVEPSKMSPYSSRSVSKARICCRRSDHCWSHGPRQAERLVPGRQLHRARAGVLATA